MKHPNETRFQELFAHDYYVTLKNHLYNYRVRKSVIARAMAGEKPGLVLEAGSGLSPIVTDRDRIVYTDLAFAGVSHLRRLHRRGMYVVADCTSLPFRAEAFTHAVCSEVLEHIENDGEAVSELSRVLAPEGSLYLTFPHRRFYFWNDDRFAGHFRRYELTDMVEKLSACHLTPLEIRKVLGPLEKLTMSACVFALDVTRFIGSDTNKASDTLNRPPHAFLVAAFKWANAFHATLCAFEAKLAPRALAAVVFIRAAKRTGTARTAARTAALAERGSAYRKPSAHDAPEGESTASERHAVGDRASTSGRKSLSFDCGAGVPPASLDRKPLDNENVTQ